MSNIIFVIVDMCFFDILLVGLLFKYLFIGVFYNLFILFYKIKI